MYYNYSGDTMQETLQYATKINELLNANNEGDSSIELNSLLEKELIIYNKKLLIESTHNLEVEIKNLINTQADSNLNSLLDILNRVHTSPIEELDVYNNILVNKNDIELFKSLINSYTFKSIDNSIDLKQEQQTRLSGNSNEELLEESLQEIDESLNDYTKEKESAIEFLSELSTEKELDEYSKYLKNCIFNAVNNINKVYYEEMFERFKEEKTIVEPRYLYLKK